MIFSSPLYHLSKRRYPVLLWAVLFLVALSSNVLAKQPLSLSTACHLYYQGAFQESLQMLALIVAKDPDDDIARRNYVQLLRENGDQEEALIQLQYLAKKYPHDLNIHLEILKVAYLSGHPEWTVENFKPEQATAQTHLWRGIALSALNLKEDAVLALNASVELAPFNPLAHAHLGYLQLAAGDPFQAKDSFNRALTQEPNWTQLFYPLAQAYLGAEDPIAAHRLLKRATAIAPWNREAKVALDMLESDYPELAKPPITPERDPNAIVPPFVESVPENLREIPTVRIGLVEKTRQVTIRTGDVFSIKHTSQSRTLTEGAGGLYRIAYDSGIICVKDATERILLTTSEPIMLSYENPAATTVLFDVDFGQGYYWAGRENRIYRGSIEFLPRMEGMTVVNRLDLESYLYAVVPSEMSAKWPAAALETQAIAARTYALANMGRFAERGFDMLGTVSSQAYNGVRTEYPSTTQAVDRTRGLILTYDNKPIGAFFSANSGGYSESSLSVWQFERPYLQAVPDKLLPDNNAPPYPEALANWLNERPLTYSSQPGYFAQSAFRWIHWVTREDLEAKLAEYKLGRIISVTTAGRGLSGRVEKVCVRGTAGERIIKGDAIRGKLGGLRSNLFVIEPKLDSDGLPEAFLLTGGGWGHGVGLDQTAAAGMAANGYEYKEILEHYYPGAQLTKRY
jgi:stage II sporulation protein D